MIFETSCKTDFRVNTFPLSLIYFSSRNKLKLIVRMLGGFGDFYLGTSLLCFLKSNLHVKDMELLILTIIYRLHSCAFPHLLFFLLNTQTKLRLLPKFMFFNYIYLCQKIMEPCRKATLHCIKGMALDSLLFHNIQSQLFLGCLHVALY